MKTNYFFSALAAVILSFFSLSVFFSCEVASPVETPSYDESLSSSLTTRSDTKGGCEDFEVSKEMAIAYAESFIDRPQIVSVEEYEFHGKTCLYIINFEKGWMVVPSDSRIQPIQGENSEGSLYYSKLDNPGVKLWLDHSAETVYFIKETGLSEYDENNVVLWNTISSSISDQNSNRSLDPEEVAWVKCFYTTSSTTTVANVDHLISTKWGQGTPFNSTFPYIPNTNERFSAGCTPVAVSQILRYFNGYTGTPNALWHTITPSVAPADSGYTISLIRSDYTANSTRWSNMPLRATDTGDFSYISDLLLDVGERFMAEYYPYGTGATITTTKLANCGISCQQGNYNYSTVRSSIVNNKPVLIEGGKYENNNEIVHHTWVIDGCTDYTVTTNLYAIYYRYQEGVLYPTGSQFLSDNDVLSVYPNAYDGMSVLCSSTPATIQYLLMNYGWYGEFDSGQYNINGYNWALGFNILLYTYHNISTSQLY